MWVKSREIIISGFSKDMRKIEIKKILLMRANPYTYKTEDEIQADIESFVQEQEAKAAGRSGTVKFSFTGVSAHLMMAIAEHNFELLP